MKEELNRKQELIAEAQAALRALDEAAEGDSNDAEIEAGRDVADMLERLLQSITEGER